MSRSVLVLVMMGVVLSGVQGQRQRPHPGSYNVTGCPDHCECSGNVGGYMDHYWSIDRFHIHNGIYIGHCKSDPLSGLAGIIASDPSIDDLQIENSLGHADGEEGYMRRVLESMTRLRALRVLRIPSNNLTEVPENILYFSPLRVLDLSHNKLTVIPSVIGRLTNLIHLDVSHNNLTTLPTASWQLSSLRWLDGSYNQLIAVNLRRVLIVPHIRINLKNNQIAAIGGIPDGEPNFSNIDLSQNKLTTLDAWYFRLTVPYTGVAWRTDLSRILNVSYNHISGVTNHNGYTALPSRTGPQSQWIMWKVNMRHNQVSYLRDISNGLNITQDSLHWLLISDKLKLENNPMICDCRDYAMYQRLRRWALSPRLTCGAPRHLKGRCALDLGGDQFVCNVTEGCPQGCYCNETPFNKSLNTYCTEPEAKQHLPTHLAPLPDKDYGYKLDSDDGFLTNLTYQFYLPDTVSVSFRNNQISYIDRDFFNTSNFIMVDLRDNRLKSVDAWPLQMVIEQINAQIYLDGNEISQFTNEVGYDPWDPWRRFHHKNLWDIFLSLRDNNVTHLNSFMENWNLTTWMLQDLLMVDVLIVSDNPLNCDCEDFEMYQLIHYRHNITCAQPAQLRGREITTIAPDEFVCVLDDGCPDGCACKFIPNQEIVAVDCQNYTDTLLPQSLPVPRKPDMQFNYDLDFSYGNLTTLEERDYLHHIRNASFSHNKITEIEREFFIVLKRYDVLHLDHNQLDTMPPYIVNRPGVFMYLAYNEWNCTCDNQYNVMWIYTNRKEMGDYANITCHQPDDWDGKTFGEISDYLCPEYWTFWTFWTTDFPLIILCILMGGVLILLWVTKVRGVLLSQVCDPDPYGTGLKGDLSVVFDVFVSYCPDDAKYIEGYLLPSLKEMGFKICPYRATFLDEDGIIFKVHKAIVKSDKTLFFVSKAYLDNNDAMGEFYTALTLHMEDGDTKLITIKDTAVIVDELEETIRCHFDGHNYIDVESPQFWDDLLFGLQVDKIDDAPDNGNDHTMSSNETEMGVILAKD